MGREPTIVGFFLLYSKQFLVNTIYKGIIGEMFMKLGIALSGGGIRE